MTDELTYPRSRRALLAGAIGAAAAMIATALGRPDLVRAADGETVVVGGEYTASSQTGFDTGSSGAPALLGNSNAHIGVIGTSTSSFGVAGSSASLSGVHGQSTSGSGVDGASTSGSGVSGNSGSGYGVAASSGSGCGVGATSNSDSAVWAYNNSTTRPAVHAIATGGNTGVRASSGGECPGNPLAHTGVHGFAAQDSGAMGVYGQSTAGRGVQGVATSGIGVRAASTTGYGALASTVTGTALYASVGNKSGTALHAVGRVRFDGSAGLATVPAGAASVTVAPGIDLVATSAVVATLQANPSGTLAVKGVVVNATADTFTIYLNAASAAAVKVAWHVFG